MSPSGLLEPYPCRLLAMDPLQHTVAQEADFVSEWDAPFLAANLQFELALVEHNLDGAHTFFEDPRIECTEDALQPDLGGQVELPDLFSSPHGFDGAAKFQDDGPWPASPTGRHLIVDSSECNRTYEPSDSRLAAHYVCNMSCTYNGSAKPCLVKDIIGCTPSSPAVASFLSVPLGPSVCFGKGIPPPRARLFLPMRRLLHRIVPALCNVQKGLSGPLPHGCPTPADPNTPTDPNWQSSVQSEPGQSSLETLSNPASHAATPMGYPALPDTAQATQVASMPGDDERIPPLREALRADVGPCVILIAQQEPSAALSGFWLPPSLSHEDVEGLASAGAAYGRYAFYDLVDHVRVRDFHPGWTLVDAMQDAIQHTQAGSIGRIRVLHRPFAALPMLQIVLEPTGIAPDWVVTPMDARAAVGVVCTFLTPRLATGFAHAFAAGQACPALPESFHRLVARGQWILRRTDGACARPFVAPVLDDDATLVVDTRCFGGHSSSLSSPPGTIGHSSYSSTSTSSVKDYTLPHPVQGR